MKLFAGARRFDLRTIGRLTAVAIAAAILLSSTCTLAADPPGTKNNPIKVVPIKKDTYDPLQTLNPNNPDPKIAARSRDILRDEELKSKLRAAWDASDF